MRINIFECNRDTFGECIALSLFGTYSPWAQSVSVGDLCFLYNYSDSKIYGVWEATSGCGNHEPAAWSRKYPRQVRVKLASERMQDVARYAVEEYVRQGERVANVLTGERAHNFLQYFASRYTSQIMFGVKLADHESYYRSRHPSEFRCEDGHMVRSLSEQTIDNWFYRHRVPHAYEPIVPIPEQLIPDFVVHKEDGSGVYVEFWGMESDETYKERVRRKCEVYARYRMPLIEVRPANLQHLDEFMSQKLRTFNVPFR